MESCGIALPIDELVPDSKRPGDWVAPGPSVPQRPSCELGRRGRRQAGYPLRPATKSPAEAGLSLESIVMPQE